MQLRLTTAREGMPTTGVLRALVSENERISALFVFTYRHPRLLQDRISLSPDEGALLERAVTLRREVGIPFWEGVLLSCFGIGSKACRLLGEAAFHQSHADALLRVSRDEVLAGRLAELAASQPEGHHLSFSSKIEIEGQMGKQIPLLDFHCPESPENDALVRVVCSLLYGHSAVAMSSGESYHALGLEALEGRDTNELLSRALLFAPIVDSRYVAHQLLEGACALRLSRSTDKPVRPRVRFLVEGTTPHA
jgi:hypothetical protein